MIPEAERIAKRYRVLRTRIEERRARAQVFAKDLARSLGGADPGVRAIIGFGSTFKTWRSYRLDSDIDLAVLGGDWGRLWSLLPRSEFQVSPLDRMGLSIDGIRPALLDRDIRFLPRPSGCLVYTH